MRTFTRRRQRAAALAAVAALAATGVLAGAPGAAADETGPWPGTEGRILNEGGNLLNPATGTLTQIPNVGSYATWAPDGSRLISAFGQISSVRGNGTGKVTLPWATGVRSSASYQDLTFWWAGRYVVFSTGGQLVYGPSDGAWAPRPLLSAAQEPASVCDTEPSVSPRGLLAFERRTANCASAPGVFVYDGTAGTLKRILADAEQPAFSPDGTRLAFVRADADGNPQVFTAKADGTAVKQLTTGPRRYANPSWSPTGKRIVLDAHTSPDSGDVHTVEYVDVATGVLTPVSDASQSSRVGRPNWEPLRKNDAARVWGNDAYATNVAASRWTWNTLGQSVPGLMNAKSAVLVNRDDAAYSLTAPALAGKKGGPVLMTPRTGLSSAVKTELKRTLKKGRTVYLVGGTSILTGTVATQLKTLGYVPKRLSGADRYATSVAVSKSVSTAPKYVFLASGAETRPALSAAAAASADGTASAGSVVLTNGNKLTASVKSYLNGLNPDKTMVIPVGSAARYALTHASFSRWPSTYYYYPIAGGTDAAVSVNIAKFWWSAPESAALTYSGSWRDGVSAGAAYNVFGPLLWTSRPALSAEVNTYLGRESASVNSVAAFGTTGSLPMGALNTAGASISAGSKYFQYRPYFNGVIPASAGTSAFAAGGVERPAALPRTGPVGADPHLDQLRTGHRQ